MINFFKKKKQGPKNLDDILKGQEDLEKKLKEVADELKRLKQENRFSVQKIGIVRYNPFSSVGSNQSFSIALLDGNNDGAIITSLYTREGNRVYGKPIKNGGSEYQLSSEEREAINKATKKK